MVTAIEYRVGDATLPEGDGPKVIAHVCNDIGKWGRGFVLALARRYPSAKEAYLRWYADRGQSGGFALGAVQFVAVGPDLWVANLIGQHGIARRGSQPPVRYEAIDGGLTKVADFARERGASLHMPRIGCGLAGGDWARVSALIEERLCTAGVPVTVYDLPGDTSSNP